MVQWTCADPEIALKQRTREDGETSALVGNCSALLCESVDDGHVVHLVWERRDVGDCPSHMS